MRYTQAVKKYQDGTLAKKVGTNNWIVASEFVWYIDYNEKTKNFVIVEKGFETNFGSIPRPLWFLFNPTKYTAYILHDFLYLAKMITFEQKGNLIEAKLITRKQADMILIEALEVEGMGKIGRLFVYL